MAFANAMTNVTTIPGIISTIESISKLLSLPFPRFLHGAALYIGGGSGSLRKGSTVHRYGSTCRKTITEADRFHFFDIYLTFFEKEIMRF